MFKIKQVPEDFIVTEIQNVEFKRSGRYTHFWLKKRDFTTEKAVQSIAKRFGIPRRFFSYSGSKDRNAVTEQLCSVSGRIRDIQMKDLGVSIAGYSNSPVSLGTHLGNRFSIIVRSIKGVPENDVQFINYFDDQRFGTNANNHIIGKLIVKRRFREAVEILMKTERNLIEGHLKSNPNDFVGCLRLIPKKILTMYIHAYQSHLFNETAAKLVKKHCSRYKRVAYSLGQLPFPFDVNKIHNRDIPIIGFSTEFGDDNDEIGKIVRTLMKRENLNQKDFIIREIPELTSEGGKRNLILRVDDIKIGSLEDDELNTGMKKLKIEFSLPPGSYATIVIKALFG